MNRNDLDNYITGHYGEDQFRDEDEATYPEDDGCEGDDPESPAAPDLVAEHAEGLHHDAFVTNCARCHEEDPIAARALASESKASVKSKASVSPMLQAETEQAINYWRERRSLTPDEFVERVAKLKLQEEYGEDAEDTLNALIEMARGIQARRSMNAELTAERTRLRYLYLEALATNDITTAAAFADQADRINEILAAVEGRA